jgi:hypothetical protein
LVAVIAIVLSLAGQAAYAQKVGEIAPPTNLGSSPSSSTSEPDSSWQLLSKDLKQRAAENPSEGYLYLKELERIHGKGSPIVEGARERIERGNWEPDWKDENSFLVTSYNQAFQLGDRTYKITRVHSMKSVGPEFGREKASEGARFILVHFFVRNDGKETVVTDADDVRLRDSEGREFLPDAATALLSHDASLQQLHPGIFKEVVTVFQVPESVARDDYFQVLVHKDQKTARFFLYPKLKASPTPTPPSLPKRKAVKRIHRHNEEAISPDQRELWRRMDRPFGVPWRSFSAEDEHGYPNH